MSDKKLQLKYKVGDCLYSSFNKKNPSFFFINNIQDGEYHYSMYKPTTKYSVGGGKLSFERFEKAGVDDLILNSKIVNILYATV